LGWQNCSPPWAPITHATPLDLGRTENRTLTLEYTKSGLTPGHSDPLGSLQCTPEPLLDLKEEIDYLEEKSEWCKGKGSVYLE